MIVIEVHNADIQRRRANVSLVLDSNFDAVIGALDEVLFGAKLASRGLNGSVPNPVENLVYIGERADAGALNPSIR
ncbi:MAG: hypothetical protein JOZ62_06155 [Acidobacteriaceae bacterium]|nr:hypothetical protein [Acidobacteriaceae bacterium]